MGESLQLLIVDQASEWYARRRDGELNDAQNAEFLTWLQTSPLHVQEYLAAATIGRSLPGALMELAGHRESLMERTRKWLQAHGNVIPFRPVRVARGSAQIDLRRRRFPSRAWAASLLVVALFAGGAGYWHGSAPGLNGWPRSFEVPRGAQRTVSLRDGSVMHLNADTRVRVRYSSTRRLIELEQGQALFNVRHESKRPFTVHAGTTKVVALGTEFDVIKRSARDAVTVTVVEGEVAVQGVPLAAGRRMRVDVGSVVTPRQEEKVDTRVATAWLRRELIFSEERLGDVAEDFSRYGVPIEIDNPALRDYRISGAFNAYDTESFVAFLRRFGEVEQTGQVIRVHGGRVPQADSGIRHDGKGS